jgi:hypothetical protein
MYTPPTAAALRKNAELGKDDEDYDVIAHDAELEYISDTVFPKAGGKEAVMDWLQRHNIDVDDVLGVLCESDIGLRRKHYNCLQYSLSFVITFNTICCSYI